MIHFFRLGFLKENIKFIIQELKTAPAPRSEHIALFKAKYREIKPISQVRAKFEITIPTRTESIVSGTIKE